MFFNRTKTTGKWKKILLVIRFFVLFVFVCCVCCVCLVLCVYHMKSGTRICACLYRVKKKKNDKEVTFRRAIVSY